MVNNKKKRVMTVLGVFALIIVTTAASFAFFTYSRTGNTTNTITSGDIEFTYEEGESVTLKNAFPVQDSVGAIDNANAYSFTVRLKSSSTTATANHNVSLLTDNDGTKVFNNNEIKYNLAKDGTYVIGSATSGELMSSIDGFNTDATTGSGIVLENQEILAGETQGYTLRIWIDEDVNYSGDIDSNGTMTGTKNSYTYSVKVKVDSTADAPSTVLNEYTDESGANKPDLASNMIPVTYDEASQNWVKADVYEKWYDYDTQMWANAVTVSDTNRATYMDAAAGTAISMDDINTMWVWVPRYEYETITSTTATEIKVNFLSDYTSNKTANYITHSAFTFGDEDLTGIWVAKFEASSNTSCTAVNYSVGTACDIATLGVKVIPNVTSWRGIRPSTSFTATRNMEASSNMYGFVADEVDTHMMKNMEWGCCCISFAK